jgi:SNF2 family DNA or RNA helicase
LTPAGLPKYNPDVKLLPPDWLAVPPDLQGRLPKMVGAMPTEIHRSHLPILSPPMRAAILAANPKLTGPSGTVQRTNGILRQYQDEAATFIRERHGSIIAFQMGTGKTRTALAGTYAPDKIGIVVAPLVAWSVWKREIKTVYGNDYPVYEVRGRKLSDGLDLTKPGIYIINPEIIRDRFGEWMLTQPEFCILDEAHLYINRKTRRHAGARTLAARAKHRVALTGTPILRHVVDLHGILNCVVPGAFGGWYDFAISLGGHHGKHGGVQLGTVPREASERLDARLAEVMIRKRWEEVANYVPPLQRERIPITLSAADARTYNRLLNDVRMIIGHRVSYGTLMQAVKLMQVCSLRRFIGQTKIPFVVELACSTAEPVVIWTWHRDVAAKIADGINRREGGSAAIAVTGEEERSTRDAMIEMFCRGSARAIVCTIGAAGVGIDFTVSRISIFAEQSWTPGDMSQAEARVFRSGQTRPCITYWPIVEGSIEDRILEVLAAKEQYAASGVLTGITSETQATETALASIVDLVGMVVKEHT